MGEPAIKQLRYRTAHVLRKVANRISEKGAVPGIAFTDLGARWLHTRAPRALVIYTSAGIQRYVQGKFDEQDPFFNKHSMYWESVEIVRQLNAHGYIVDYADKRSPIHADWKRYALIIDQWDNLQNVPTLPGLKKVHYTTYTHWLGGNQAELERIAWFKERTGIVVPMNRQMPTIRSDEYADYLTYFGTQTQANSFSEKPQKYQLDISAVHIPEYRSKDIEKARKNFMWLGGGGMVHKGLDIAMEAFARTPDLHLFVAGNPRNEPGFWQWAEPFIARHKNIHLLGWMDTASPQFDVIARNCIGIVYPSAAEGGPGSVAQALHWGLIPLGTLAANIRAQALGILIEGQTAQQLIKSTADLAQGIADTPAAELAKRCDAVIQFAQDHHTRTAYTKSLSSFLEKIST